MEKYANMCTGWREFVARKRNVKRLILENIVIAFKSCTDERRRHVLHMKIVKQGMELVRMIAIPTASQLAVSKEDLIQVGALGLIKAIEFFEPGKNATFETYANYFIKGEIRHYVRDKVCFIKTPRRVHELLFRINSTKKSILDELGDDATEEMLAEALELPIDQVEELLKYEKYRNMLSLDQAANPGEDEEIPLMDKIPADDSYWSWDLYEDKLMLSDAISKLPPELKHVIELSYYNDLSQREVAKILHVSQMQVSRQLKKAMNCLYDIIKQN